jgi:hypothetical protein
MTSDASRRAPTRVIKLDSCGIAPNLRPLLIVGDLFENLLKRRRREAEFAADAIDGDSGETHGRGTLGKTHRGAKSLLNKSGNLAMFDVASGREVVETLLPFQRNNLHER